MSDEVETVSVRDELRNHFRMLCMGRPHAAERLADMLAPLLEPAAVSSQVQPNEPLNLPVIDMGALSTEGLAALSTTGLGPLSVSQTVSTTSDDPAAPPAPAKTTKARKAR